MKEMQKYENAKIQKCIIITIIIIIIIITITMVMLDFTPLDLQRQ